MSEIDDEILQEFITESIEGLDELEPLVVGLQGDGDNKVALNTIFRHLHSIKGTASFVDLPALTHVAHAAENLLDSFRHDAISVTPHRIDLLCEVIDVIRHAMDLLVKGHDESTYAERADKLSKTLNLELKSSCEYPPGTSSSSSSSSSVAPPKTESSALPDGNVRTKVTENSNPYKDSESSHSPPKTDTPPKESTDELDRTSDESRPSILVAMLMPDLVEKFSTESEEQLSTIELTLLAWEKSQATSEMLEEAFRAMHSLKGNCGIMGLADMQGITHHLESTFLNWKEAESQPLAHQVSTILRTIDILRLSLLKLVEEQGRIPEKDAIIRELLSPSKSAPPIPPSESSRPLEAVVLEEASTPERNAVSKPKSREVVVPSRDVKPRTAPLLAQTERVSSSIRVDTRKLDELMNLVGELIIAETTVTHNPDLEGYEFENFPKAALNLNHITRQLQDVTMQARMVPIETTFRKMIRLVRDVSQKQGKKVKLVTVGEETEVDKSVIETIADPLVHLIRNGIDHGLEDSNGRTETGKNPEGCLQLRAHHQGGEVWISIQDDGRGIDPDKILASAISKGVAEAEHNYTRDEILQMVFAPGFSTATEVTDISGRGVGMDVVKRNIEKVNGRIDIDTKLGHGTTFTLRIPLTLAIIEGMLVRVGSSYYIIPLLSIMESVRATHEKLTILSDGQELLKLREEHYPITKLSDLCCVEHGTRDVVDGILVLVESEGQQACILVDEVVGQRQTVIKPLPDYLKGVRSLGGCSILHNGSISLILDIDAIVRNSLQKEEAA